EEPPGRHRRRGLPPPPPTPPKGRGTPPRRSPWRAPHPPDGRPPVRRVTPGTARSSRRASGRPRTTSRDGETACAPCPGRGTSRRETGGRRRMTTRRAWRSTGRSPLRTVRASEGAGAASRFRSATASGWAVLSRPPGAEGLLSRAIGSPLPASRVADLLLPSPPAARLPFFPCDTRLPQRGGGRASRRVAADTACHGGSRFPDGPDGGPPLLEAPGEPPFPGRPGG